MPSGKEHTNTHTHTLLRKTPRKNKIKIKTVITVTAVTNTGIIRGINTACSVCRHTTYVLALTVQAQVNTSGWDARKKI